MIAISELSALGVDEGYLRACLSAYQAGEVTVAVTGEFSSGKSSFLNALAGRPGLLPEADVECTPIYVELSAGTSDSLAVLKQGGALTPGEFDAQTIEKYARNVRGYRGDAMALVLSLKDFPLAPRIHIIDCPGTNTVIQEHEKITEQVMRRCDVVVYAVNKTFSETDLRQIEQIYRRNEQVIFLLTHMDDPAGENPLPQETIRKYMTEARSVLSQRFGSKGEAAPVFPIGSKLALRDGSLLQPIVDKLNQIAVKLEQGALREQTKKKVLGYLTGLAEEEKSKIELMKAANAQDREQLERKIANANRKMNFIKSHPATVPDWQGKRDQFSQKLGRLAQQYSDVVAHKIKLGPGFNAEELTSVALKNAEEFDCQANRTLRRCVTDMAQEEFGTVKKALSELADSMELPLGALLQITPPDFSDEAVFDSARAEELQRQIDQCERDLARLEEECARNQDDAAVRRAAVEAKEREKAEYRQALRELGGYQPVYQTIHKEGAGATGAKVGRVLGEVADVALLFWNPVSAAASGAKAAAEGAQAVAKGAKAAQIVDKVKDTLKITQYAASSISRAKSAAGGTGKEKQEPSAMDRIASALDTISLGGLGERFGQVIGEMIDPSTEITVEDENVRQQYYEERDRLDREIKELTREIQNEENEISRLQSQAERNRRSENLLVRKAELEKKQALQRKQDEAQAQKQATQSAKKHAIDGVEEYFLQRKTDYETAAEPIFKNAGSLLAQAAEDACKAKLAEAEELLNSLRREEAELCKDINERTERLDKLTLAQDSVDAWLGSLQER